ncbi:MAG: glyoxylate carboligase [Methylobacteriaceae bacterium]|jgi:tartronate-semialdehyde synthase|nr:glyoxylate carboligase [Methylobacteriaceae bacterium]
MTKMRAVDAAVQVLLKEGITAAFGVPGAAINPLYSAMMQAGGIDHILARHVEGASHMAEGYTRAKPGNIGVCIGTSGPGGTDMITALYSATSDSIPLLCITGQAPRARLYKEDFQCVDIESIAKPVAKMAVTVREPGLVPRVLQKAFHVMRSGRPGPVLIDLPFDVQVAEIEFDPDTYEPLPVYQPTASVRQMEKVMELLAKSAKPVIVAGGGVLKADASAELVKFAEITGIPVIPTLMGWGAIPDDHPLMIGRIGIQSSHRYANISFLESDFVLGIGNRWANRHTGTVDKYTKGRTVVHIDIEPTQIGRVFNPDYGVASDAKAALEILVALAEVHKDKLPDYSAWAKACYDRKRDPALQRKTHFNNTPMKPQRVYEEMNRAFGKDVVYVTTIGLAQIAANQMLNVYKPRHWINSAQAGPLGWTMPAALGVVKACPEADVVAISGDYDFEFLIEELAVGAQFNLPYVHVLLNNSYLGLIRQAQRAFNMDYCVQLSFENINAPEIGQYGVDHKAVVEGLGCKAIRVFKPEELAAAFAEAQDLKKQYKVPVVVECILERVTNISMGGELDAVTEFEETGSTWDDAPTSIGALERGR